MFALLEKLGDSGDAIWAWQNIRENGRVSSKEIIGPYEWKQREPKIFRSEEAG